MSTDIEQHDFAVFIGRFQPFHSGHLTVVKSGLANAERLIVLIGSAWQPRNPRNPWTHQEREEMIRSCLSVEENQRLLCLPLMDMPYNDEAWVRNVQTMVSGMVTAHFTTPHRKPIIALIGHRKDETGFYLSLFPQWKSLSVNNYEGVSATPIRESYFSDGGLNSLKELADKSVLPGPINDYLAQFEETNDGYKQVKEEVNFVAKYRSAWNLAPYAPTFVTVDAVVVQSGHVLLIERRASPGKGLWALPGGFLDSGERLLDACLRELREETKLKVPSPVLRGSIKRSEVYDDPNRSARGRTLTHAFYIELEPDTVLPKVRGGDDARRARWVPLGELEPKQMFEDHYFIIQDLIGAA